MWSAALYPTIRIIKAFQCILLKKEQLHTDLYYMKFYTTLFNPIALEWPKLQWVFAILSVIELKIDSASV